MFPSPVLVEQVTLQFSSFGVPTPVARYRIEIGWQDRFLPLVTATDNPQSTITHMLRAPFLTDQLRVAVDGGPFVGLAEITVDRLDAVPTNSTTFDEPDAPDSTLTYRVTAIDRYSAEG